jgi:hypothetical protein
MSGLAKVFLVINLVLTIIFLGTSATLFSVRKDWKEANENLHKEYQDKFVQQAEDVRILEEKVQIWTDVASVQHAEIVSLRKDNKDLDNNLSRKTTDLETAATKITELTASLEQRGTELTDLAAQIDSMTTKFETAKKAADTANVKARDASLNENQMFLELQQVREELAGVMQEKETLRTENEQLKIQITLLQQGFNVADAAKPIAARIVGVRGDLVMLSVGRDDGVTVGMVFAVSRGDQYVGDVRVRTVYKDMAGAQIIHLVNGAEIQEGDNARTKQLQ